MSQVQTSNERVANMFLVLFIITVIVVIIGLLLNGLLGIRLRRRTTNGEMENLRTIGKRPSVVVRIVDPASSNRAVQDSVPIYASDDVYASIGVTGVDFASWQQRYGMDSLGTTAEGELFIPEYPVLSKVAWTHIDSVTLTSMETRALIEECHRAAAHAVSEAAKQELESISVLARKALDHQAVIRFGHA